MARSFREPSVRLGTPTIVTVASGECSDPIALVANTVEWRVKRLEASAGDLRYEQDGTPTETAGYFLTADDPVSEWHDAQGGPGASVVRVFAIGGDVSVEIGMKVRL